MIDYNKVRIECPCVKVQQDEHTPVNVPSLLCECCEGLGRVNLTRWAALVVNGWDAMRPDRNVTRH